MIGDQGWLTDRDAQREASGGNMNVREGEGKGTVAMMKRVVGGRRFWVLATGLVLATMGGGCQNNLKTENESLWKENQDLHEQLRQTQEALDEAQADRARLNDELAVTSKLSKPLPIGAAGANTGFGGIEGVEVATGPGTVTVRVPGDVLFDSGKVAVKGSAQATLNKIAQVLKTQYAGKTIRIEGYTDTDPIRKSGWRDNLQLSAERAMAVQRHLASQGVKNRMYSAAFGESSARSSKAASRRVEIVVIVN